jgi:hypothetical protein
VSYKDDYKNQNTEAPFYWLIRVIRAYLDPENYDFDQMVEDFKFQGPWTFRFKEQLSAALLDPSKVPDGAIFWAASYDDGNDIRFLRRLWRDLYPSEPVPDGDDEFREDLRKLIHDEVDRVPSTVSYYDNLNPRDWSRTPDELQTLGRTVWKRFYPDEPLP